MSTTEAPPRLRVGFLYPGFAAEDDYPSLASRLTPALHAQVVHTSVGVDAHRVDDLLDLGGAERLADGVHALDGAGVGAVVWACTSGSFVFGPDGAAAQVRGVAARAGVPASSTSFAFVHAAHHLGVRRVAVAATYPQDVADAFRSFLAAHDLEVVSVGADDVLTATEVGTFGRDRVLELVRRGDHPDADVVLVPDTALHTAAWLAELEDLVAKPVLTANQVTVWEGARLLGARPTGEGLGALFAAA